MTEEVFNLNPDTMLDIQKEMFKWQVHNFGEQNDRRMVLGICEESGELCHAQLKGEQGIREGTDDSDATMKDAIGDICIYAMNLLSNVGEGMPGIAAQKEVEKTSDNERIGDSVLGIFCTAAKIETARKTRVVNPPARHPSAPPEVAPIARHAQQLFMHLNMLCGLKGWNLEQIVRETWKEVGKRNWKRYPKTGLPSENAAPDPHVEAISAASESPAETASASELPAAG